MFDIKAFLFDDDRGVSPVIGVILMVAITVILAAVIASFVLGLGDTSESAPSTSFDYDYNETGKSLAVTVEGGDTFDASNANVTVGDNSTSLDGTASYTSTTDLFNGEISAGDSFTISNVTDGDIPINVTADSRVDIVFEPDEGGSGSIISTFTGPDA